MVGLEWSQLRHVDELNNKNDERSSKHPKRENIFVKTNERRAGWRYPRVRLPPDLLSSDCLSVQIYIARLDGRHVFTVCI